MALITCPECGQQISDKAVACIHCGFPINQTNTLYDVIFNKMNSNANRAIVAGQVRQLLNINLKDALNIIDSQNTTIFEGLSQSKAEYVKNKLESYNCIINITPSKSNVYNDDILSVKCPRCGSTTITTTKRGFKLTTGFIGANKVVNLCSKCGYSWTPR